MSLSFGKIVGVLLAGALTARLSPTQAAPVTAKAADGFVDTIGVNTHVIYTSGPYGDKTKIKNALQELGVRYIRDAVNGNAATPWATHYNDIYANTGVKVNVLTGYTYSGYQNQPYRLDPSLELDVIKNIQSAAVISIEGENEANYQGNANWISDVTTWQKALWNKTRTDANYASLASKPILSFSLAGTETPADAAALHASFPDAANYMSFSNIHPYPGGWLPENTASWMEADIDTNINTANTFGSPRPIWATETGYINATALPNGSHVSEQVSAVYLPRLFLLNYQKGIQRTFWYDLFEGTNSATDPGVRYGLYLNDGTTKKKTGNALKNLIGLLKDPGPAFTPSTLAFTLSNSNVKSQLFQKRNGEFWLALWLTSSMWDNFRAYGQKLEIDPADQSCTLSFGQSINKAVAYTALDNTTPGSVTYSNPTSLNLTVSERVMLVKIERAGTGSASVVAEGDAYVKDGTYATTNFGTVGDLMVRSHNPNSGNNRRALLRFPLQDLGHNISSVKLRLYVLQNTDSVPTTTYYCHFVSDDTWSETGVNWNNQPSWGALLDSRNPLPVGSWMEFDVTNQVKTEKSGDGKFSSVLLPVAESDLLIRWASREGPVDRRPYLMVTYTSAPSGLRF